jgi:hypothetical protein
MVLDRAGRATQAGAEVRLLAAEGTLLGTRLVPTGDGYGSQGVVPVHFGLAIVAPVTVEVTFLSREGSNKVWRKNVNPSEWQGKSLVVKAE